MVTDEFSERLPWSIPFKFQVTQTTNSSPSAANGHTPERATILDVAEARRLKRDGALHVSEGIHESPSGRPSGCRSP
jgi:hypothetical protein